MRRASRTIIFDRQTDEYVEVDLVDGVTWDEIVTTQLELSRAITTLLTNLTNAKYPPGGYPEHAHWDWQLKYLLGEIEWLRLFGIRYEAQMQGFMMVKPSAPSKLHTNSEARQVYVDYLASAPWNLALIECNKADLGRWAECYLPQRYK
jgi:hypothetical protein